MDDGGKCAVGYLSRASCVEATDRTYVGVHSTSEPPPRIHLRLPVRFVPTRRCCGLLLLSLVLLFLAPLRSSDHFPGQWCKFIDRRKMLASEPQVTHRFLIASLRPIRLALLTASARLILPISRRFIFDGLGSFKIHSGTADPDCSSTFAILLGTIRDLTLRKTNNEALTS